LTVDRFKEGSNVHIVEEDDGSGWVKVADGKGGKGLVPASYVEPHQDHSTAASTIVSQSLGSGKYGA
jgi:formin-binding protein 1